MVWALAVHEATQGPPFAEVILEVGAGLHGELMDAAVDSGFVLAAGEAPDTSGVVEVGGGLVERLVLVGGRLLWEPDTRVEASPGWLAAAQSRGAAVVILVPGHLAARPDRAGARGTSRRVHPVPRTGESSGPGAARDGTGPGGPTWR